MLGDEILSVLDSGDPLFTFPSFLLLLATFLDAFYATCTSVRHKSERFNENMYG